MHILLIDDEVHAIYNLALFLREMEHTSSALHRVGDESRLRTVLEETQPDAVVLDFSMDRNGAEVYRWIKSWNPAMKIVFYTAYGGSLPHHHQMLAAGASEGEIIEKREVGTDIREILKALT